MSGEKRVVVDLSWEFTVGLVLGILIGGSFVQGRSCVGGGRQTACWEEGEGWEEAHMKTGSPRDVTAMC